MKYDALIFDVDGVLVDVRQSYWEAIKQTVQSTVGKQQVNDSDIAALKKIPGFNNDWDVSYALVYGISDPKTIDRADARYQKIKDVFQSIYIGQKLYEKERLLVEEKTLEKLAQMAKLGIVTSRPREEALVTLRGFIPKFFDERLIVAQEDCEVEKPDPTPLLLLQKRTGGKKAIYVGDSINDAQAAKAAGMPFVSVTKDIPADFYLENVNQILEVLEMRMSAMQRETKETRIQGKLNLDGSGAASVETGIGFFDHMLATLAKQGIFDIELTANGDLQVDGHHTVEDAGIVLGQLFREGLGNKEGINRYGFFLLPMDEALALAAIDLDGRSKLVFEASFSSERVDEFETQLVQEFFEAFVRECRCSLQLRLFSGSNDHHKIEALFKAFARALRMACELDPRRKNEIPSTKEVI